MLPRGWWGLLQLLGATHMVWDNHLREQQGGRPLSPPLGQVQCHGGQAWAPESESGLTQRADVGAKDKGQDGSGEASHWAGPAWCPSGRMGGAGPGFLARSTGGGAPGWSGLATGRLRKKQKPVRSSCQSLRPGEGQDEVTWGSLAHREPRSRFSQILR